MTTDQTQGTTWPTDVEWEVVEEVAGDWVIPGVPRYVVADAVLDGLAPHVARREREAAYAAWSEGRATGWSRAMRLMSDELDVDTNPPNPYDPGGQP